jgi:pectin methylesterase-like acyl-CoA thioesterase
VGPGTRSVRRLIMSGFAAAALAGGLVTSCTSPGTAPSAAGAGKSGPHVLLVGTFNGVPGKYHGIQAAVDAALPGDWILVGPGDYHENADETGPFGNPAVGAMGGVYISKSGITLRGMNRNTVIVDGTKAGSPACSSDPAAQNYGRAGAKGTAVGRNGILVWKASDVSVENLTVCNFLAGTGASGNQVW